MLQLNSEQVAALQTLKVERDTARLATALATAFPEVHTRLGDRFGALVALGIQHGGVHGLDHVVCLGRLLACWCVLGAAFEVRPEGAWAHALLADPALPQGSKVFQLCRRTREELARQAGASTPGLTSPAAFDVALTVLDGALGPLGVLGSLSPCKPIALGDACDLDALDLRLVEAAPGRAHHRWRVDAESWQRVPTTGARPAVTLSAGAPVQPRAAPPALPPRLHLLSHAATGDFSRLRLRTRGRHCCDAQVHPLVTLNGSQGLASWRGAHAADVMLDLYAEPTPPSADDAMRPVIAAETSPQQSVLTVATCGLRDEGQALGEQTTTLAVYPAEQHWMLWRREPGAPAGWPDDRGAAVPPRGASCRVERDGLALDASRWQAGLGDLDRQLAEGLARLATAWERESGVSHGRLAAEPTVMAGTAGITWGWADGGGDLAEAPWFRLAGQIDLVACQLQLRMAGDLALHGSHSRLALHCAGRAVLKATFDRATAEVDMTTALTAASTSFRHPFVAHLESLAQTDSAALADTAGPVGGALVGACGLRPRPAGPGLQWFCELAIEPVSVALRVVDPLLGIQSVMRPLLPAMTLVNWSLG